MKKSIFIIFLIVFPGYKLISQNIIPNITIEDSLENEYLLPDVLQSGKNYVIVVRESWEAMSLVQLVKWKECYIEWEDNYNLEVFVLSADGTEPEDKELAAYQFNTQKFDYHLYFANTDTVQNQLGVVGYPTNFLVNSQGIIVDTILGRQDCSDMSQLISSEFDLISSIDKLGSKNDSIAINSFDGKLMVKTEGLREDINLIFYSINGRRISTLENMRTDEWIDLPEMNGVFVVQVIGKDWMSSQKIMGH